MAYVCRAAIPALQLSRGNGFHGVNPYQRRACHQTIRQVPQAGRWLLYGAEPARVHRTGKRVRNLRVQQAQHSQILAFQRDDVGRAT
jgi:hypothetical protein